MRTLYAEHIRVVAHAAMGPAHGAQLNGRANLVHALHHIMKRVAAGLARRKHRRVGSKLVRGLPSASLAQLTLPTPFERIRRRGRTKEQQSEETTAGRDDHAGTQFFRGNLRFFSFSFFLFLRKAQTGRDGDQGALQAKGVEALVARVANEHAVVTVALAAHVTGFAGRALPPEPSAGRL